MAFISLNNLLQEEIEKFKLQTDKKITIQICPAIADNADYQINLEGMRRMGIDQSFKDFIANNIALQTHFDTFESIAEKNIKLTYFNFVIKKEYMINLLNQFDPTKLYPKTETPKKIIVDYSSPNLAKDMHVGHMRSTFIGDSLANLLEYIGHNVVRQNHIGDFGLPFGMIVQYIIDNNIEINDSIVLQQLYIQAKNCFDVDEAFKNRAYEMTAILQKNDDSVGSNIWKQIKEFSLKSYQTVYKMLNISPKLSIRGEAFYADYIDIVKQKLIEANVIEEKDGRCIANISKNQFMTFSKSEMFGSAYTYDTTDIVALWHRLFMENAEEILYVVDSGQSYHFNQLFTLASNIGWSKDKSLKHINFGIIKGLDNKRIKSRNGDTPKLSDLIDDGIEEANKIYLEKNKQNCEYYDPETIKKIALGCIKYYDSTFCRTTDYVFDSNNMLKFNGNTYIRTTYVVVRCKSVFKKLAEHNKEYVFTLNTNEMSDNDWNILRMIFKLPDCIKKVLDDHTPHVFFEFMRKLVDVFHYSYDKDRCINANNGIITFNMSRLTVYKIVEDTITQLYKILGLPADIERL